METWETINLKFWKNLAFSQQICFAFITYQLELSMAFIYHGLNNHMNHTLLLLLLLLLLP